MKRAKELYEEVNHESSAMQAYDYIAYIMHEVSIPFQYVKYDPTIAGKTIVLLQPSQHNIVNFPMEPVIRQLKARNSFTV